VAVRIKNWAQFQHFKDRRPPWVKLYRDLLDDMEWHELDAKAAKALVMFWLIASESDGELPDSKKLAFRLRTSEKECLDIVSKLSHWLEQDDINAISTRYQDGSPETETETETETEERRDRSGAFEKFWTEYPNRKAKSNAVKAWDKIDPALYETIMAALRVQARSAAWLKDAGQFVPHPATWLNGKRWEDSTEAPAKKVDASWLAATGFDTAEEARNFGCHPSTAHLFRDGRRIEEHA
jgi:hypothetical protein